MAKFLIEVDVDDSIVEDNDKSAGQYLSEEMGWVAQSGIYVKDYVQINESKKFHLSDVVKEDYVINKIDENEPRDYTQTFIKMLDKCELSLQKEDGGYALMINHYNKNIMEEDFLFVNVDHIIEICDEHAYLNDMFYTLVDDVKKHETLLQEATEAISAFPYATTAEWVAFMDNHSDFKDAHSDEYMICQMMDDTNKTVDLDYVAAIYNERKDVEKDKTTKDVER